MAYNIYWIRHEKHKDPLKEGYIGFSSNVYNRFKDHVLGKTSPIVNNAINKHKDQIVFDILYSFENKEEALQKEKELRPHKYIGWNIAIGGNAPPEIKNNIDVKRKISKSIIAKGIIPYCENTHSKESLAKSSKTKKENGWKWYHNTETLESKLIPINKTNPPIDWVAGRVPSKINRQKTRGIDFHCNAMTVDIYLNDVLLEEKVTNFKMWCKNNNLPYFAASKTNSYRILKNNKKIILKVYNGLVYENEINTKMKQKQYAQYINKSQSYVSNAIKKGFYIKNEYDVYSYKLYSAWSKQK
jgi:predicted GIY-YIG superfamily endonuclease